MGENFSASNEQYQEIARFAREAAREGTENLWILKVTRSGKLVSMDIAATLSRTRNQVSFDATQLTEKDAEYNAWWFAKAQTIHTHPDHLEPSPEDLKVFAERWGPNLITLVTENEETIVANFAATASIKEQVIDGTSADLVAISTAWKIRHIDKTSDEARSYGIAA